MLVVNDEVYKKNLVLCPGGWRETGAKKCNTGAKSRKKPQKKRCSNRLGQLNLTCMSGRIMYIALASMHVNNNHLLAFETSLACLCLVAVLFLTVGVPNV